MPIETSNVDVFNDVDGRAFSYVRGCLIVRDERNVWDRIGVRRDDPDRVAERRVSFGDTTLARVTGFEPGEELELAAEIPEAVALDHALFAHHAVHPSQLPHQGATHELTADWVAPLADDTALTGTDSYSAMRASPLHMNPLHMNPLHMNPLHMNPLRMNPLHMNPLHMNGLVSSAIPTDSARRRGEQSGDLPEPPEKDATGDPDLAVYIIDSGLGNSSYESDVLAKYGIIGGDHVDEPATWEPLQGKKFVDPIAGHGTFIAGIYAQVLHAEGRLPKIQVYGDEMNAQGLVSEWDAAARIAQILLDHADSDLPGVLNLSFGGTLAMFDPGGLIALKLAVDAAAAELIVVASAGNVSVDDEHYPAAFPSSIAVGALDADGVAWFSNFGEWVDCWAAGVDVISPFLDLNGQWKSPLSQHAGVQMSGMILGTDYVGFAGFPGTQPGHHYKSGWVAWSGTSFAAPIVGAAAGELLAGGAGLDQVRRTVETEFALVQVSMDDARRRRTSSSTEPRSSSRTSSKM